MTKIVINGCYGGFCISDDALKYYNKLSGKSLNTCSNIPRHDPFLVQVVEEMGKNADRDVSALVVLDIDEDKYYIEEYDGKEYIITPKRMEQQWVHIVKE